MSSAEFDAYTKIAFEIDNDDGTLDFETLWAVPTAGGYRIDNIPFYVRGIAWGDVVRAEPDADGQLSYEGTVAASGHSTIRLWVANPADVKAIRDALRMLGCGSELNLERLVAVDIPRDIRYSDITAFLDEQERLGTIEYEEGCIGHER